MALLTYRQVAAELGIGVRTVERLVAGGELRTVRIGRSVRVDPDDLAGFVRTHRAGEEPGAEPLLSGGQRGKIFGRAEALASAWEMSRADVLARALEAVEAGTEHVSELTASKASDVIDWLLAELAEVGTQAPKQGSRR